MEVYRVRGVSRTCTLAGFFLRGGAIQGGANRYGRNKTGEASLWAEGGGGGGN